MTHIKLRTKTLKFPTYWLPIISLNRCAWTTIGSSELYLFDCRILHIVDSLLQTGIDSLGLENCTTLDGWNDSTRPSMAISQKFNKFVKDTLPKPLKLASFLVFGFLPIIAAGYLPMCSNELEPYSYLSFSSTFHESSIIPYFVKIMNLSSNLYVSVQSLLRSLWVAFLQLVSNSFDGKDTRKRREHDIVGNPWSLNKQSFQWNCSGHIYFVFSWLNEHSYNKLSRTIPSCSQSWTQQNSSCQKLHNSSWQKWGRLWKFLNMYRYESSIFCSWGVSGVCLLQKVFKACLLRFVIDMKD